MRLAARFVIAVLAGACASPPAWQRTPHDRLWQRAPPPMLHAEPKSWEPSVWYETLEAGTVGQWARAFSPGYWLETGGAGRVALDVNAFGQVPDSTWFENRIARRALSADEVRRGPNTSRGPNGVLTVTRAKSSGVTPGFVVRDATGERWLVKLDPPEHPALASGAEIIATKLLWAAGYNVPENHIAYFSPRELRIAPDATMLDRYAREVRFGRRELDALLAPWRREHTTLRALFSRYVPGKPVGPYPSIGTRPDDPNDRIPHERRRSLRGLSVLYAWLDNVDAKSQQSLDAFVVVDPARKLGYLRHYLVDFGSALGSAARGPKPRSWGEDYEIDWGRGLSRSIALGLAPPPWLGSKPGRFRSLGALEARGFDPARWRPLRPNRVFELAQPEDVFWAAAILAHFDTETVRAAVATAEYTEPGATAHVTAILLARRDAILRWAFSRLAPLDEPTIVRGTRVTLIDLELMAGLVGRERPRYRWRLIWNRADADRAVSAGTANAPSVELAAPLAKLRSELAREPFLTLAVRRTQGQRLGPELRVRLRRTPSGRLLAIGLERDRAVTSGHD